MTASDYDITFPYGATDPPYSATHPHRGDDRPCPSGTPIVIDGVSIGLTGGATGFVQGAHLHIQEWSSDYALTRKPQNAFAPGTVVNIDPDGTQGDGSFGKFVTIQTADGWHDSYCHLSQINVSIGQVIPSLGVDYSFARPGGAAIAAAGFKFVCRYLASSAGKALSKAEADELHASGLPIVLVFEDYANPKQNGSGDATATGTNDAKLALTQATALGVPSDRPIYFAVDYDAPDTDQPWLDAYLKACATVLGEVGVYGGYNVVKRCLDNGSAKWAWQTLAWSQGQIDPRVHIYQNGQSAFNGGADIDEARQTDFGQWPQEGVKMAIITTEAVVALSLGTQGTQPQSTDEYAQWVGKSDQQSLDDMITHYSQKGQTRQADLEKTISELTAKLGQPSPPPPDPSVTVSQTGLWAAFKRFLGL